ncbi:Syntaxin-10 [Acromyrmex echinatior]|uniref:Syntaxin-10 n=1 Tax=Acromyrmex echinatior TaxID=103372 RepID=F4X4M8_ACREC|nr:Syntaxin-10 [Acromyrmex echinatior]
MTLENPFFVVKEFKLLRDRQCALIGLDCFSEVCKALNKNRGLYGRWSELQNVAIASPTGIPLSGSATAISRTDELDWTTTELRKALRSIEWDLDDLEDTIYILFQSETFQYNLL